MKNLARWSDDGALAGARGWAGLDPAERRRRATVAANDRDREQLLDLLLAHLALYGPAAGRLSRHTAAAYGVTLTHLLAGWSHVNLLRPRRDDAALLLREWEDAGASPATVAQRLAGCRALYRALRWAVDSGAGGTATHDLDPFADVRAPRDPVPRWEKRQPYHDGEVRALLAAADDAEMRLLLLLCAHGGLRLSESLALSPDSVDLATGTASVTGKGGRRRTVELGRTLRAALAEVDGAQGRYLHWRSAQGVRDALRALCERARVQYRGVHSLRHTCGTRLYRESGRLELVQRQLGHADISTTQVYAKLADRQLRSAVAEW